MSQPLSPPENRGEDAHKMLMAATNGQPFEAAGVPDHPHNRALFSKIRGEVSRIPEGSHCAIPFDWALMP